MEERIEQVWTLTLECLAWQTEDPCEPRVLRSVARVIRPIGRVNLTDDEEA